MKTILHQEILIILNRVELTAVILSNMGRSLRELGSHRIADTSTCVLDIIVTQE